MQIYVALIILLSSFVEANVLWLGSNPPQALSGILGDSDGDVHQVSIVSSLASAGVGADFIIFIGDNQNLLAVGANDYGQLGTGDTTARTTAAAVAVSARASKVVTGRSHVILLDMNSVAWGWGSSQKGQLGLGSSTLSMPSPVRLSSFDSAKDIAAGLSHSLVVGNAGIFSFGDSSAFQLGLGDSVARATPTLIASFPSTSSVVSIACGAYHNLVVTSVNLVYSWGANSQGQLGVGTLDFPGRPTPSLVWIDQAMAPVAAHAGGNSSVILMISGSVFVFGNNDRGQLGLGDFVARSTPSLLTVSPSQIISAAVTEISVFYLKKDGVVACGSVVTSGGVENQYKTPQSLALYSFSPSSAEFTSIFSSHSSFAIATTSSLPKTLSTGVIVALAVSFGVVVIVFAGISFFFMRRRSTHMKYKEAVKAQKEARLRLGMTQGSNTLALEEGTHRTWNVGSDPSSPTVGEPFDLPETARGRGGIRVGGGGGGGGRMEEDEKFLPPDGLVVEELEKLPPWRPQEDEEPLMAYRIIRNRSRIRASRVAAALLMLANPQLEPKMVEEATTILEQYPPESINRQVLAQANPPDEHDSDEEDEEAPQLEASVLPGPVRTGFKLREEAHAAAMRDAMKIVHEMQRRPRHERAEKVEIGIS